jgi:hypothetical protein
MVTAAFISKCSRGAVLAAEQGKTLLERLDPQSRAGLLAALAGLVVLAIGSMVVVYLGARHVKRIIRQRPPERRREPSDWQRRLPAERFPPQDPDQP